MNDLKVLVAISVSALAFIIYYFGSDPLAKRTSKLWKSPNKQIIVDYAAQKLLGLLIFGIIPALFVIYLLNVDLSQLGLNISNPKESLMFFIPLGLLVVIVNRFAASKPGNLEMYPQLRISTWTPTLFLLNVLWWGAYLMAYEFLFRGVLLFLCLPALGTINAIAINTAFYAFAHIHKGYRETIGAIPLGILLCAITIHTGSIWGAFLIHLALALSNDAWSIYYSKEILFIWKRERVEKILEK